MEERANQPGIGLTEPLLPPAKCTLPPIRPLSQTSIPSLMAAMLVNTDFSG